MGRSTKYSTVQDWTNSSRFSFLLSGVSFVLPSSCSLFCSVLTLAFSLSWLPGMTSCVPMLSLITKVLQDPEFYMLCQDFLSSDSRHDIQSPIGYFYWEMLRHLQASVQNFSSLMDFFCVFPTAKYITEPHLRAKVQRHWDCLSFLCLSNSLHLMSYTRLTHSPEIFLKIISLFLLYLILTCVLLTGPIHHCEVCLQLNLP